MNSIQKIEVREDEEQTIKLQQMLDLLLASGYFRARIKTLSSFDKIVGGIVWCISKCHYDIDIDLLFQEDSTIGSKIALTEKIVIALKQMKCPHLIEPHQIQGLDFRHIFPVVQWLVKKAIETQKGNEHKIREYSIIEFNKYYSLPENLSKVEYTKNINNVISYIENVYCPRRKYKQIRGNLITEEEKRIQMTLLEYDRKSSHSLTDNKKIEDANKSKETNTDNQDVSIDGLSENSGKNISMKSVANLFKIHSAKLKETVDNLKTQIIQNSENCELITSSNLRKQIDIKRTNLEELKHLCTKLFVDENNEKDKLHEVEIEYAKLENEITEIKNQEGDEKDKKKLNEIQALITENENLKKEELKFKEDCLNTKRQLTEQIEDFKQKLENNENGKQEVDEELQKNFDLCSNKLKKMRLSMATMNREIASMQRTFDDIPSRAELQQYQARFLELYNQVSLRQNETKHFYNVYNTLEDTRLHLNKEINLLNSIGDTFQRAMTSKNQKSEFFKQFEMIVESVKNNKEMVEKRLAEEKIKQDALSEKIFKLNEQNRQYCKVIKEFQEECHRNELLNLKLQEL